jgi:hypothetical protein
MFCDRCGTNLQGAPAFCPTCGKAVGAVRPAAPRMPEPSRIAAHLRTLGFLWIAFSVLRLLPRLLFFTFWRNSNWFFGNDFPFMGHWFGTVAGTLVGFSLVSSVLGVIAGWGLLERQPWARILAIVLAFLSLLHIPFGTALGIFTLWVLLPAQSEQEYRQISGSY